MHAKIHVDSGSGLAERRLRGEASGSPQHPEFIKPVLTVQEQLERPCRGVGGQSTTSIAGFRKCCEMSDTIIHLR